MRIRTLGLALCGAVALAWSASAGVISVNFADSAQANETIAPGTSAGLYPRANWNNTTAGNNGLQTGLMDDSGASTAVDIEWSSNNMYFDSLADADADLGVGDAQIAAGYLDDGGAGINITVSNIPYASYYAVVLFSTDGAGDPYAPATINGSVYNTTGNRYRYGNPNWQAYNVIVVPGLTDTTLTIIEARVGGSRASIGGIQIVESTEGAPPAFLPTAPEWTSDPVTDTAYTGLSYNGTLVGKAYDRDADDALLTYTLIDTGTWLTVNPDGTMTGTVPAGEATHTFTVSADDGVNAPTEAQLEITATTPPISAISVSFQTSGYWVPYLNPDNIAGIYPVANWNNTTDGANGTLSNLVDSIGNVQTGTDVTWSSGSAMNYDYRADWYAYIQRNDDVAREAKVATGSFGDGSTSISIPTVPYPTYTAVIYFATKTAGGTYNPTTINGSVYNTTGDKALYEPVNNWKDHNTIVATGLTGPFTVTSEALAGGICGFQIVPDSEGAPPEPIPAAPVWYRPQTWTDAGWKGHLISGSVEGFAYDDEPFIYTKVDGEDWLTVETNGTYYGTPTEVGTFEFTLAADDGNTTPNTAPLTITVTEAPERQISINFIENDGNQGFAGGQLIGPNKVDSANWNNTIDRDTGDKGTGSMANLKDYLGATTTADINWISSGPWYNGDGVADDEHRLSVGYLDDGNSGISITVSDIPYTNYRVYGLFSSGQAGHDPMVGQDFLVNGTWAYGGASPLAADVNGTINGNNTRNGVFWTETVPGSVTGNYWTVESSGSTLNVTGQVRNGAIRGSLAGLIIEEIPGLPQGDPVTVAIAGPVSAGTEMVLSWDSQLEYFYTVQTNANLIAPNWGDVETGIPGTGTTVLYTNAIHSTEGQIFYQVITEE